MTIFSRIKHILSANFNSLLEKAEDPESLLEELVREMDAGIIELRDEVNRSIATEKRLNRQVASIEKKIRLFHEKSKKAVMDGDDGMARQALARKLAQERNLAEYAIQHGRAKESVELLKTQLRLIDNKVRDAHRRKELLAVRKRGAQARKAMFAAARDLAAAARRCDTLLSDAGLTGPTAYSAVQEQVFDLEFEADALAVLTGREPALEEEFEKAGLEEKIEQQLRELKERLHPTS